MEEFAGAREILFDKTGTLTTGKLKVTGWKVWNDFAETEALSIIYNLEMFSSHPIATSLLKELKEKSRPITLSHVEEVKGYGMKGQLSDGRKVNFGSKRILSDTSPDPSADLFLTLDGITVCTISVGDEWRKGAKEVMSIFKHYGVKTTLVSGDRIEKCQAAGTALGLDEVHGEKLPEEKLKLVSEKKKAGTLVMVGDGINDAPALAASNVGISLSSGTQIAIRSAQIILLGSGDIHKLSEAYMISRHTLKTIRQNLFWAFAYNVVAIPIAACGLLSPMIGALSMAFSDIVVIGNSLRLRSKKLRR